MSDAELFTQLTHARAHRDYCLHPPRRRPEDVGDDLFWLMGYADWAIEAELIEEELTRRGHTL